jgi:hypothetical protein
MGKDEEKVGVHGFKGSGVAFSSPNCIGMHICVKSVSFVWPNPKFGKI